MNPKISATFTGLLLLAVVAACSNDKAATPGSADTFGGSTGAVAADDFCHVDITGDVTASFDSPGGFSNISYGAWIPASNGTVGGIAHDDTFFIMNCQGPNDQLVSVSIGLGQHLPMSPASYPIRKADNHFGGYDSNPPVVQASPFIGGDFSWAISAESVFTITEFDESHIAGTFQFYVSEAQYFGTTDALPAKTAVITGTFNLKNPN